MLLERQFGNRINIKDLTIEAPEKEPDVLFDSEMDITEEDWEKMKECLEASKDRIAHLLHGLEAMLLLKPERRKELVGIYGNIREEMRQRFERARGLKQYGIMLLYGKIVKLLFPEDLSLLHLQGDIWNEVKTYMREEIAQAVSSGDEGRYGDVFVNARELKLLFPDYRFDDSDRENMLSFLKKRSEARYAERKWMVFLHINANLRRIFPDAPLSFDKASRQGMREAFKEAAYKFSALDLKILAAEKVQITDSGIEIIMPKKKESFQQQAQPLPEVRNF